MDYQAESWSSSYNSMNIMPLSSRSLSSSSLMTSSASDPVARIERVVSENAVVIFSISSCCMCHAVKRLFRGMGVSPAVHELDLDPLGHSIHLALLRLLGPAAASAASAVPAVFIGGNLVGTMDRVMASHINGTLVPLLKEAGALWL